MMLDQILSDAKVRSDATVGHGAEFVELAASAEPARGFASALSGPGLSIIAEVKRRSPSRGVLAAGLDAVAQARTYEAAGAAAISVLTEPLHFDGSLDDLVAVREAVSIPLLRKDFLLEPEQIWEARAAGADAALLIVAVMDDRHLARMLATAREAGVEALVEVHNVGEAERAVAGGATLIGVNNRDLATFETTLATAETLASSVCQAGIVAVAESGIHEAHDARRMASAGYQAILVGEALVIADDPAAALSRMVAGA